MNTLELQSFLDLNNINRKIKMIVCPIDKLKKIKIKKNREYGIVVNLSNSSEPGSHWTGLYINNNKNSQSGAFGAFFDSYGFSPRSFYIEDFIKQNCSNCSYNQRQLQQLTSKVCGMYAACFVMHMSNGGTLDSFTGKFSKNLRLNPINAAGTA